MILRIKSLMIFVGVAISLLSCEYREIADAEYPEQKLYMPAAYYGLLNIDNVEQPTIAVPTPGNPYNYQVDLLNKKFNIPLSVYRAGINNDGVVKVDISVNTDTVTHLISIGRLNSATKVLTSDRYSLENSVQIEDGKDIALFSLSIPLDTLRNSPNTIFAIGIRISSTERPVNRKLATTVVVIHTKMIKPTANFAYAVDVSNAKKINFTHSAKYGVTFIWDFGDGSEVVTGNTLLKPSHVYAAAGTYNVTLKVRGATGEMDEAVITIPVTVN